MTRKVCPPLQGAFGLAANIPWQLGGLLALLAYWILHDFASRLALFGVSQYIVPGVLSGAALISFVSGRHREAKLAARATSPKADALARMSAHDLEKLVAEAFRREGFLVVKRTGKQHLAGVDLELFMGRDRYLVVCRRWQDKRVEAASVRELYATIRAERAVGGFVVTAGKITDEARKVALGKSIRFIPADALRRLIKKVTASSTGEVTISPMFSRWHNEAGPPACPQCGKVMMPRTTKQGGSVIQLGWDCTSFPACQGSRDI